MGTLAGLCAASTSWLLLELVGERISRFLSTKSHECLWKMLSSVVVGCTAISVARLPSLSMKSILSQRIASSASVARSFKTRHVQTTPDRDGTFDKYTRTRGSKGDQERDASRDCWTKDKCHSHLKARLFPARSDEADANAELEGSNRREIVCAEAVEWMEGFDILPGSVFTSLPDIIELAMEGREEEYKAWFSHALDVIFARLGAGKYAIFYQTDVKVLAREEEEDGKRKRLKIDGPTRVISELLDKSALCIQAAERNGCKLMWRKMACKGPPEALAVARPSYSHLVCFARPPAVFDTNKFNTPEVFPRGLMLWPKALGLHAAMLGVRFLKEVAAETTVVDPFCGMGTIPAAANLLGMDAIGVDLGPLKCEKARRLVLEPALCEEEGYYEDMYRGHMAKLNFPIVKVDS